MEEATKVMKEPRNHKIEMNAVNTPEGMAKWKIFEEIRTIPITTSRRGGTKNESRKDTTLASHPATLRYLMNCTQEMIVLK